jgi:DNA-binding GntR family transcriptional regulator
MKHSEALNGEWIGGSLPLPEVVYRRLRSDILNGFYAPGQFLRQEELAKLFSVSRVPLREALARLETEGLLTLHQNRGYAVTSLNPAEIVEIFELRAVIEEHAGDVAARARTAGDVVKLEDILNRMRVLEKESSSFLDDWLRYNYDFHECLIAATHRARLARTSRRLRDAVEPLIRVEARITGDVDDADQEHEAIFDALSAGDARGLAQLSRRHVENTADRLLKGLRRGPSNAHSRQSS